MKKLKLLKKLNYFVIIYLSKKKIIFLVHFSYVNKIESLKFQGLESRYRFYLFRFMLVFLSNLF